jgi:8-oxo-dGTP diphosphatase
MTRLVHVAVGVIIGVDNKILIAQRAQDAHQGGLWEFPGGKVADGESVLQALTRELHEELAINVTATTPLLQICHDYGDKQVLLDVHKVTAFTGTACGNEGQPVIWVQLSELAQFNFPAANRAILNALRLPDKMLITGPVFSTREYLERTERALNNGIRMVQLRCPDLPHNEYILLANKMHSLCAAQDAELVLNTSLKIFSGAPAAGLHLNRHELFKLSARPVADSVLFGVSCHNAEEVAQARKVGADYMTLSPVAVTASHPGAAVLGWDQFTALAEQAGRPVYALGGMREEDLTTARLHAAHGIAAISCWW